MKILVVGNGDYQIYAPAFSDGFSALGLDVVNFFWSSRDLSIRELSDKSVFNKAIKLFYKLQNKFLIGPTLWEINKNIYSLAKREKPNLIFIYRGTHLYPETIKKIKKSIGCIIFGYNNDDPFSLGYPKYMWRLYMKGLKFYDHIFAYREKNLRDYQMFGYINVSILKPYYIKKYNYPCSAVSKYSSDVCFIGHYEPDGRDTIILKILEAGVDLKLFGTGWSKSVIYKKLLFYLNLEKIEPIYNDYNVALASSKIAMAFLSKLNNDVYTRRCFEIPAAKTMLLCERTDTMMKIFKEAKEAVYFSNADDCIRKIHYYLKNDRYKIIADLGYNRLVNDGHEVVDRCQEILEIYKKQNAEHIVHELRIL